MFIMASKGKWIVVGPLSHMSLSHMTLQLRLCVSSTHLYLIMKRCQAGQSSTGYHLHVIITGLHQPQQLQREFSCMGSCPYCCSKPG